MLVGCGPSMLQACRADRLFGDSVSHRSFRVRALQRSRSFPGRVVVAATQTGVKSLVKDHGAVSVQGTSRKRNEDRFDLQVDGEADQGQPVAYAGVFDGHGGIATSDWLERNFADCLGEQWSDGQSPERDVTQAFLQADKALLAPKKGVFGGFGERGIGGSKCGATGAVAVVYQGGDGKVNLLAANAGDARVVLARKGKAVQLSEDHVPDMERERQRIESKNPNPKMPLVRYVGGTWRVGGILALSRAFGDAYLKGSGQFEGVPSGSDGYGSGFGVVADPTVTLTPLTRDDTWVIVASDGLFENEVRGGGGGLENQQVVDICLKAKAGISAKQLARELIDAAQSEGTTDDVTVALLKLSL
ncbi:hypothetical protein ABBQ32_010307 [Trebouxia sp. C0010 RCD-2024]